MIRWDFIGVLCWLASKAPIALDVVFAHARAVTQPCYWMAGPERHHNVCRKGCCAYTPQVLDSSQCTPFNACKGICLNEPPITACFYAIETAFAAPLADCANAVSTWQA